MRPPTPGTSPTASRSTAASTRSCSPIRTTRRWSPHSSSPHARVRGRPGSYSGLTVPARSTRVIDLGAPGAGAQNEPILAVSVTSTRGRLVVGRSQRFLGGGRLGTQVTVASPAPRDQWWFANGRKGTDTTDRYSIYNPTDDDVEVDTIFLGIPEAIEADPIPVRAHEVVTFEPGSVADLPEGRYAVVFATLAEPSVVDRAGDDHRDRRCRCDLGRRRVRRRGRTATWRRRGTSFRLRPIRPRGARGLQPRQRRRHLDGLGGRCVGSGTGAGPDRRRRCPVPTASSCST